jgi:hypothetical protein
MHNNVIIIAIIITRYQLCNSIYNYIREIIPVFKVHNVAALRWLHCVAHA